MKDTILAHNVRLQRFLNSLDSESCCDEELLDSLHTQARLSLTLIDKIEELKKTQWTLLGWANSWRERPLILEDCNHIPDREKISNCVEKVSCPHCQYFYYIDSSD